MAHAKKPANDSSDSSPERILLAAEKLFADNGFDKVSLRKVTAAAGVNLAAVHYHFGSKDGLVQAVLRRNIQPINQERLRILDQYEAETDGPLEPERILEAFLRPGLEMNQSASGQQPRLMQLYGRIHAESDSRFHKIFVEMFSVVRLRFAAALQRSLPHLDAPDIAWRMHFVIGVMAQTCSEPGRVTLLSDGVVQPSAQNTLEQMIPFLAAGLRCERVPTTVRNISDASTSNRKSAGGTS
jgi:AcrR family transcriptional regulator